MHVLIDDLLAFDRVEAFEWGKPANEVIFGRLFIRQPVHTDDSPGFGWPLSLQDIELEAMPLGFAVVWRNLVEKMEFHEDTPTISQR